MSERVYIGLYIDILGQSSLLKDDSKSYKEKYGPIVHFIKQATIVLDSFRDSAHKNIKSKGGDDWNKNYYIYCDYMKMLMGLQIKTFSDCLIICAPFENNGVACFGLVQYLMTVVSVLQISSIRYDFPYIFRGSLELGKATELDVSKGLSGDTQKDKQDIVVYGPLFAELNELEKNIQFPIVAIGECLKKTLEEYSQHPNHGGFISNSNSEIASKCYKYISHLPSQSEEKQNDGKFFIDFIGMSLDDCKNVTIEKLIEDLKANYNCINERIKHDGAAREKYEWLKRYYENATPVQLSV